MSDQRRSYDHLLSFALEHPWAVTRPMLRVIAGVLGRRLGGDDHTDVQALTTSTTARQVAPKGTDVAILPIHGVIAPRMNLFSEISGGTTFEGLTNDLHEALDAANVGTIVLDIDSPGGNVAGASEFAREVMKARTRKPIIAVAQYSMCSAAYWVGSCATEIVASPSAQVGSIGVFSIHEDLSAALEKLGIKVTYISAGKYKVEGNETEPLSDEARGRMQERVDHFYGLFVSDVAKGRGVAESAVRSGYGQGLAVTAPDALQTGMIDRIETLSDTIARVAVNAPTTGIRAETPLDTSQEPERVTDQDRALDRRRNVETSRALLDLAL
jgi:signal peptide peptidase SppA